MFWTSEQLQRRLDLGEDSRIEFKQAEVSANRVKAPRRSVIADELAAFGNTFGGTLIFSVSDSGQVLGLDRWQMDALEAFVCEVCENSILPPLAFTTQRLALEDGRSVLIVEVEPSASVHKSPGGYYRRQGSTKRVLPPEALRRLFDRRSRYGLLGPDESVVDGTGRNTFETQFVRRFLSSRTTELVDAQLYKLGLTREDERGVPRATVAGIALCTENPAEFIRCAVIEAVRYNGTTIGTASQHDAASITGPLDHQIRRAVNFVKINTWIAARKDPGRIETPQFSPRAVFEAIVNAVVHRDYSLEHARIRLFIFDDRLEIYSPGGLPNSLPVDAMRYRQFTRNETIASLLRMLVTDGIHGAGGRQYFLEQRGEGIPVIYEQTQQLTGQDPVYELLGDDELRLTIPAAERPLEGIEGKVSVFSSGQPVAGATVHVLYPNATWMQAETDSFGRVSFGFHSKLPITVLCAGPRYAPKAVHDWHPPELLSIHLRELQGGGSTVFTEQTGFLPTLRGRLNPILDYHERMYLYATNIAIDDGKPQPVQFRLNEPLRLTDIHGFEWEVRFIELVGKSSLLEYRPPQRQPRRQAGS